MSPNIEYKEIDQKTDLINKHLKYLFDTDTSQMLRILAVEFLYPYRHENNIQEKLEFFYKKEKDRYIKGILGKAINGELENYLETEFEEKSRKKDTANIQLGASRSLTSGQLALLKQRIRSL